MIHRPRLRHLGRALAFAALFATGAAHTAFGQAAGPQTKPGEIILYMQPGTADNVAKTLAATVNPASVTPLLLKDCYVLELPVARATVQDTAAAVATLKMNGNVRWVGASRLYKPTQVSGAPKITPNDPMFAQQWYLSNIKAPQAWVLSKGATNVNLAWIDTGFATTHEDLAGQYLPDSYNFADNNTNIDAGGSVLNATEDGHGIATSSIAFGITNNSKGIAGIDWGGTKCLALKAKTDGQGGFGLAALLNSYAFIMANKDKDHIVAVNMSYGADGGDPTGGGGTDPEFVATKALADAGVFMVASAGNSSDFTNLPAAFPHMIAVSALDRNNKIAAYSSFGKIEMSAPGGDNFDTGNSADGMAEADFNNTYVFESGTSNSAPVITSVFGLLMAVPGVTPAQAKKAMYDTANRSAVGISTVPDPKYGYGLVDAYAALLKVSVSVVIDDPIGIDAQGLSTDPSGIPPPPTETLKPVLRFKISNVPLENLIIKIDAGTAQEKTLDLAFLQQNVESGNTTGANPQYVIAFRYPFLPSAPFNHTITITGTNPTTGTTATDTRTFTIQSHTIPSGLSFLSFPYFESPVDSPSHASRNANELLGPTVAFARFLYRNGVPSYIYYNNPLQPGENDVNASLLPDTTNPAAFVPKPDTPSIPADSRPLGIGYFVKTSNPVTVVTYGASYDTSSFRVPLHTGWNMIGNPYKFAVPFDSLVFEQNNGTRVTAEAAADQKLILPFIYRYVSGQYQFETLPAGSLRAWEGQWLYVTGDLKRTDTILTLITTPVAVSGVSRAAQKAAASRAVSGTVVTTSAPKVTGTGNWTIQLQASSKDLRDGYNFIGVTSSATKSAMSLVPKPPQPSPYVTLGIVNPGGAGPVYAQSLQVAGGVKTWDVVVSTDQPNTDITLNWPNIRTLPRNYRLTLKDTATGQMIDLRNQASYQFNSGHSAGTRAFTLTAHPTNAAGRAVLTNININPPLTRGGRSTGAYQIGYTVSQDAQVEVAIVGYNGQTIALAGPTRAVSSGDNSQVWNGKDNRGATVPSGTYLLQVKAITSDGTVSRETRPLVIAR